LVLDSLRENKFSHSSITDTAVELGNVSRTLVSKSLRGAALKAFVENDFDRLKLLILFLQAMMMKLRKKLKIKFSCSLRILKAI